MNNIWYSKDGKTMVNLDNITSFRYYDRSDLDGFDNSGGYSVPQYINEVKLHGQYIVLKEGGYEMVFRGNEALEIFNKLSNKKQLLSG
jgi:hypothetical protein